MEKQKKLIDDLFKAELGDYSENPPPAAWHALEKQLGKLPPAAGGSSFLTQWVHYVLVVSSCMVMGISINHAMHGKFFDKITGTVTNTVVTAPESPANPASTAAPAGAIAANENTVNTNTSTDNSNARNATNEQSNTGNNEVNNNTTDRTTATAQTNSTTNGSAANSIKNSGISHTQSNSYRAASSTTGNSSKNARKSARLRNGYSIANNYNKVNRKHPAIAAKSGNGIKVSTHLLAGNNAKSDQGQLASGSQSNTVVGTLGDNNSSTPEVLQSSSADAPTTPVPVIPAAEQPEPVSPGNMPQPILLPAKDSINKHKADLRANSLSHFIEVGLKAGYEGGISGTAARKTVVSPYVQFRLNDRFSILTQPSVKFAHVSSSNLTGSSTYYKENNDSSAVIKSIPIVGGDNDSMKYVVYSQTHDSIVKTYSTGGTYAEFELPILLRYSLTRSFGVYGGFTIDYSRYITVSEHTYNSGPILAADSTQPEPYSNNYPHVSPVSSQLSYTGSPITSSVSQLYSTHSGGLFRVGYMIGFNYTYSGRWLLDALVQQASVKPLNQSGYNTNAPFSAPYFRITLGYRIY